MLKVLIADDEKKVCQLIVNLVEWKSFGFEIVGVVNDGISAYKFLQDNTVNVMITDIRMPGCDGMELIQKAKVLYPDMYIVIISGYSQFDYAQNAIRFGVEDYLLKPIRKKDLTATLEKIIEKCREEILDAQKWEDMQKRLEENEERLKGSFLEDLLKRPEKFGGFYSLERINGEYHYHFEDVCYQTFIIKAIPGKRKEDSDTRRILLQKGTEIVKCALDGMCNEAVTGVVDGDIYGILNGTEEEMHRITRKLKKVKLDILRLQDVFEEVQVYIGLGRETGSIREILESFETAGQSIQQRFYFGEDFLLKAPQGEDYREEAGRIVDNGFKKRFLNYIEIIDLDGIGGEMDDLEQKLSESPAKDGRLVASVYKEVLTLFYFGTHNYNIEIPDQYPELLKHLEVLGTIHEAAGYLKRYMVHSLMHWIEEKKYVESRPIRLARQFIGENYYLPLTLETVSREIGFNPTYFSGMFKKETGKNFSDYLKEIRIENAKNMLLNTEQQVEDISFAVGYSDIKYFSRLFKKQTGVTPTEFRRLYN
ncbi:response regulator transcription factor [[Clostridium] hylemonae]|uniref:response regulator transcription factor n=1 Tax=[Clostridium] hylemonae TaxID=89153 RepID=UPI00110704C3|nr:response regulator [[Clostridium] hylemonae]